MFFPEGKWINYWPGKAYEGNTTANVDARLTQVPLFVRAGAIIPMREYAPSVELGNNKKLMLDIYPHNSSSFTLFEDDGSSNDYIDDAIARTVFRVDETSKITTVVTEAIKEIIPEGYHKENVNLSYIKRIDHQQYG